MVNDQSGGQFEPTSVFEPDDYLYFYGPSLTTERTLAEASLIWRLLDLHPRMSVLDLACGHGRIANQLASWGCRVIGVDVTTGLLDVARANAAAGGLDVEYIAKDMRELNWVENVDRVISWFTSFGFYDDVENRDVLKRIYRSLRPGGQLLLELNNRDFRLRNYQRFNVVERDDNFMIDRRSYDATTGRHQVRRSIVRDGGVRSVSYSLRLLTLPELADWLSVAGFEHVDTYGPSGDAFSLDCDRRLIAIATRGAS